ncbi:hypothetical protein JHK87_006246 [Glycine soja]|nr:hypothetical protein JHK87_006246 [Glycine soja]KAG5071187.1 hypothetical protein JHK86_006398 [Glycine max]
MSSSSTMPLSSDPPFLCADEAAIVGLLDVEPHHMPEKDYLRRCRDHSINVTAVGKGSAFAPGLFAVKGPDICTQQEHRSFAFEFLSMQIAPSIEL